MTSGTEHAAYYLGRPMGELKEPFKDQDKVFAAVRLDEQKIADADFKHCTFANISFKQVTLQNAEFLNCVFIGCYFRRADITNTIFIGCRFIDCKFPHVTIKSCDFRQSSFHGCQIAYSEMENMLPTEHNLREEISRNLALESAALGLYSESRKYRMAEIQAREKHLKAAFLGKSQWYKDHFDFKGQVQAFYQWSLSLMNGWLWGHGERAWVLIRNLFIVSVLFFPVLFYIFRDDLEHRLNGTVGFFQCIYYSIGNIIPSGIESGVIAVGGTARFLAGLESFLGLIVLALFASYLFRWILHR